MEAEDFTSLRDAHISIRYGIKYEGRAIENLSPGARGVVLLTLFLAIDDHDDRPLVIDQPEENLGTIFGEPTHFAIGRREALARTPRSSGPYRCYRRRGGHRSRTEATRNSFRPRKVRAS